MKKVFILLIMLIIPVVINAKSVITVIEEGNENNYKIEGNYGWTFRFKDTTVTPSNYHLINTMAEAESSGIAIAAEGESYYNNSKNFYLDSESDCSSGKIYLVYNNIGVYQGEKVNLKITLTGCKFGVGYSRKPHIGLATSNEMQFFQNGVRSANLKYEFLNDKGERIDIKGYGTFVDLDVSQAFKMGSGVDKAYIYENYSAVCTSFNSDNTCNATESGQHLYKDKLTLDTNFSSYTTVENAIQSSNRRTYSSRAYKYAWSTILFSGGEFNITYYVGEPGWETSFHSGGMFKFMPDSLVAFDVEDPVKNVNKKNISVAEEYTYTTSHRVPYINKDGSNNTYTAYSFSDKLEPCLTLTDASNVVIKNDYGTDVTSNFDIKITNDNGFSIVSATAKEDFLASDDFYGHEYEFMITTSVKNNYDLSKYLNSSKTEYVIPNKATIEVTDSSGTYNKPTNKVDTVITIPKESVKTPDTGKYVSITLMIGGAILMVLSLATLILYKQKVLDKN